LPHYLEPARYKGAHGGRGSGKSHFFAEQLVEDSLYHKGLLSVCLREVQQTLKHSSKRLIEKKLVDFGWAVSSGCFGSHTDARRWHHSLSWAWPITRPSPSSRLEGFGRAWFEEAQTLSLRSLTLLRPTIRAEDSEIWAGWNPRRKSDAIDEFLEKSKPRRTQSLSKPIGGTIPWFPIGA
jgi:phage terminase large subunit